MEDLTGSAPPPPSIRIIRLHDLEHETEKWLSRKQRRPSGPKKTSSHHTPPNFSESSVESSSSFGLQPPDKSAEPSPPSHHDSEDSGYAGIPPGKSAGITVTPKAPAVTAAAMAVVVGAEASSAA